MVPERRLLKGEKKVVLEIGRVKERGILFPCLSVVVLGFIHLLESVDGDFVPHLENQFEIRRKE